MTKHKSVYHRRTGKYIARLALMLGVFQLIAVLGSWIFKAVNPELPLRSLLSAEGIRWMVGSIGDNLAGRGLVWLLLGSMAFGSVKFCGILDVPRKWKAMSFWDRFGLMVALAELLVIVVLTLLLTVLPHAVLLGVTGNLYPSSFSKSLFFIVCLSVCRSGWLVRVCVRSKKCAIALLLVLPTRFRYGLSMSWPSNFMPLCSSFSCYRIDIVEHEKPYQAWQSP